ncbi:oxidoreductase [Pediococcus argentinicus]|nr:oxidoreductase [Pediococcus argentinicus]NKZ21811.1 oxidoreductase [Pediococcus argentinicus]GEP18929.1 oxidoreductase [Pediococcus argentinicus]
MSFTMAIIGFGKSANRYHIPYIKERDIKIKYIYNHRRHPEKEQGFYDPNTIFTEDLNEVLSDPEIQLVTVCTPPATHFKFGQDVLNSGKNVLIEKPFCNDLDETKQLLDLANRKNLVAMAYQNRRFDSDFLTLKSVLEKGYVGKPLELESHFDKYRPNIKALTGDFMDGTFYGLGIHIIDQIVALFGKPEEVGYDIRPIQNQTSSTDDYFQTDLYYENFKVSVKSTPLAATPYPRFVLHGTQGSFVKYDIDQQENDLKLGIMPDDPQFGIDSPNLFGEVHYRNQNNDWITKQIPTITGDYGLVYDSLIDSIINDQPKLVSDEELITDMQILEDGVATKGPHITKSN